MEREFRDHLCDFTLESSSPPPSRWAGADEPGIAACAAVDPAAPEAARVLRFGCRASIYLHSCAAATRAHRFIP